MTDPDPDDVDIVDIAHALSHICRYAGHCKTFYSVAEHSYIMSQMVPPEHALQALLHDATEAYCQDLPRPLKAHLPEYRAIEQLNRAAICKRFGLALEEPTEVRQADRDILLSEHLVLFGPGPKPWVVPGAVLRPRVEIRAYSPAPINKLFLQRYEDLKS
jgi:hypothetical protein